MAIRLKGALESFLTPIGYSGRSVPEFHRSSLFREFEDRTLVTTHRWAENLVLG